MRPTARVAFYAAAIATVFCAAGTLAATGTTVSEHADGAKPPLHVPTTEDDAVTAAFAGWPRLADDDPGWAEDVQSFYAARGGTPLWHSASGLTERGRAVSQELAAADDWGLDPSTYRVTPPAELTEREIAAADVRLTFAAIRYAFAAQNGRVNPSALSRWLEATPKPFNAATVLASMIVAEDPAAVLRDYHPQHAGFERLRRAYLAARDGPKKVSRTVTDRMRANLERWRWLPADLGERYVWNNIPAYETRVYDNGVNIFRERLIVGGARTQTPVFSDIIRFVVFQPDWGVPPSLKVKDLLPRLARGDTSVLDRRDMRIVGRSPATHDWSKVDIRQIPIVQNPGPSNPLGRMKFMFPNRHHVYMHDTPTKHLFARSSRALSNGCIRVRDPMRFAETLLAPDKGWSRSDLTRLVSRGAPQNNRVDLDTPVPVHNVYFTVVADEYGKLTTYGDVYGHDRRVSDALDGEALDKIAARDPALAHDREIERLMEAKYQPREPDIRSYSPPPPPQRPPQSPPVYSFGGPGGGYPSWARSVFGFR